MFSFVTKLIKIVFLLCLLALFVVFITNNPDPMAISLAPLPYVIELPLFVYAILFFLAGFLIAAFMAFGKHVSRSISLRKANKRIDALENEVRSLRAEKI